MGGPREIGALSNPSTNRATLLQRIFQGPVGQSCGYRLGVGMYLWSQFGIESFSNSRLKTPKW
jgi:hypothetical protein